MTIAQKEFLEEYVNPVMDKYWDNPDFNEFDSDGGKTFDAQKAMLFEGDVFTPLTNEKGRVYGFSVGDFPYKFIDARYPDEIPLICGEGIENSVKKGEETIVIVYVGFNEVFLEGSEGQKEWALDNPEDKGTKIFS